MLNKYPYTDLHELNLDWILKKIKELSASITEFEALNQITYGGIWDITKQYAKWTVVLEKGAYLSIKPVPVGVNIDNADYWVKISDYSSLINSLAQANDNNRKYLFLGDSYYLGGTGPVYTGIGWAEQIKTFLGLPDDRVILATTDDICPGGVVSTPGFYASSGTHRSFKTIIESMTERLSNEECASITDILVCGGYNDMNKGSAIEAGIIDFSNFVKEHFPYAKIWCACIGYSTSGADRVALNVVRTYYRQSIKHDIAYIDNAEYCLCTDSLFISDGIHPTQEGYEIIGSELSNGLIYGGQTFPMAFNKRSAQLTITESGVTQTGQAGCVINDYGVKTFYTLDLTLAYGTSQAPAPNAPLKVEFECDTIQPTDEISFQAMVDFWDGNNKFVESTITLKSESGKKYLYIRPCGQYMSNITAVIIYNTNFTCPAQLL